MPASRVPRCPRCRVPTLHGSTSRQVLPLLPLAVSDIRILESDRQRRQRTGCAVSDRRRQCHSNPWVGSGLRPECGLVAKSSVLLLTERLVGVLPTGQTLVQLVKHRQCLHGHRRPTPGSLLPLVAAVSFRTMSSSRVSLRRALVRRCRGKSMSVG